jgi:hypothetical protein
MRKLLIGFMVVLVIGTALYFRFRGPRKTVEVAYAGSREVLIWNSTAQIRATVATAAFGDRLQVLRRYQDQVQVRTAKGVVGWTDNANLLSADVWQRAKELESRTAGLPIEARGHTHAISNFHIEAGRDSPRIRQVAKAALVDLFERKVAEAQSPATPSAASADASADAGAGGPKKEDWWLVRAHLPDQTTISGWILDRFIDLDVPAPLPDYASAAGMHIVAWFELNRVPDASGAAKPQYLVVGSRGPEGQPCDFTLLRVFTWGKSKQRYETAYVESGVCGILPVSVEQAATSSGGITFAFKDLNSSPAATRTYRMYQTVVRRVKEPGSERERRKSAKN